MIERGPGRKTYSGSSRGCATSTDGQAGDTRLTRAVRDRSGSRGSVARFWGQIRPGTGVRTVNVLRLRPGQNVFRRVATVRTDARGYWTRRLRVQRRAKYRFAWEEAGATAWTRRPGGCRASSTWRPIRRGSGTRRGRERLPGLLHGGLLARGPARGGADGQLAGARRALEGRPRGHAARPRGAAAGHAGGDRVRRRGAAGRARRARGGARARRLRALAARGRDRARARRRPARRGVRRRRTCPAEDGAYDLAILSHVLEHVPEPMSLLREAARVAPAVLVEVPLEDNRSARRDEKRAEAARIGHIQFFDRAAVHALIRVAGLTRRRRALRPPPLRPPRVLRRDRGERATRR